MLIHHFLRRERKEHREILLECGKSGRIKEKMVTFSE
jgi:hypothetical protein